MASSFPVAPAPATLVPSRLWVPRRVLVTRAARAWPHARVIVERAAALGAEVIELPGDRVVMATPDDPRRAYAEAKATLAVVVAPPSKLKLEPIAPSADWRVDLAAGCPAHCSYCYLAGSLKGAPTPRVYVNLDQILDALPGYVGRGTITSSSRARAHEGTTFEASCYTDPLGIEPVTGSLSAMIAWFGRAGLDAQLRFTTKFADVEPLLGLEHNGHTRMRASINPARFARFEGGTAPVAQRLAALRRMADAGYPVGLTIAPILPVPGWEAAYAGLIREAAEALADIPDLDLTAELITHRFTPGSKEVLQGWYPGSDLPLDEAERAKKLTKFGSVKYVFPKDLMRAMRDSLFSALARDLPAARILYWT